MCAERLMYECIITNLDHLKTRAERICAETAVHKF